MDLGLSGKAVVNILKNDNWINIYKEELEKRSLGLTVNDFPEKYFNIHVNPHLEVMVNNLNNNNADNFDIRKIVQKWKLVAHYKANSMIQLLHLIPKEFDNISELYKKFHNVPRGPQSSDVVNDMDVKDFKKWKDGNIALFFADISINNVIGLYISELFFSVEAMCRAICIGSCYDFAINSVKLKMIQHEEIFKTLKRLGGNNRERNVCKSCPILNKCLEAPPYDKIAYLYEVFYHLRAIKDYRLEYYFNSELIKYLKDEYLVKSFQIAIEIDKILEKIFKDFMLNPLPLNYNFTKITKILANIAKQK